MSTRKLMDGREIEEQEEAVTLTIKTKCPEKWMLVDKETGEMYEGFATEGKYDWRKLTAGRWVD